MAPVDYNCFSGIDLCSETFFFNSFLTTFFTLIKVHHIQSYGVLLSMEPNNTHIFSVNVAVPLYFMSFIVVLENYHATQKYKMSYQEILRVEKTCKFIIFGFCTYDIL
jgi:hypothetical protein